MRNHLKVDSTEDDVLIDTLISVCTEQCEHQTNRKFVTATYDQTFDTWADEMLLPYPPLSSVTSVTYYDEDGVEQTLSSSIYDVVTNQEPGRIRLAYDQSWPTHRSQNEAITIRFVAGYGDADDVPSTLKQAMLLLGGHLYENREAVPLLQRGEMLKELPIGVRLFLWSYKVPIIR
jgi:uncharacterized phiE125 gp8 family phage protein